MESSATEAARKKANALLAERAAIVKVGVDESLKCTVEVPSEICRFCDQPAIMRNRGHCAACASFWIPALNRPGSLLLGPEFMHSSVVPYNKVTCDYGLELCKEDWVLPAWALHPPRRRQKAAGLVRYGRHESGCL